MSPSGYADGSKKKSWNTPPKYVSAVKEVFGGVIELDPCSNDYSIVGARVEYKLPEHDGLKEPWNYKTIFVNPPYGRGLNGTSTKDWVRKCAQAHVKYGAEFIALLPVATNTTYWRQYIWGIASAIAFLYDTRLKFYANGKQEAKGSPLAHAMVYWGNNFKKFNEVFQVYGAVVDVRPLHNRTSSLLVRDMLAFSPR